MPYAHATKTPEAHYLRVIDRSTGNELREIIECDSDAGWLVRFKLDQDGRTVVIGDELVTERVDGVALLIEFDEAGFGSRNVPDDHPRTPHYREWKPKRWPDSDVQSEF